MKTLLITTSLIEFSTGLILVSFPSELAALLLGSPLDSPGAQTVARVAGVALIALGTACWIARSDNHGMAAKGVVIAMFVYNAGILVVLIYAGIGLGLLGIGLWPVVVVHFAMGIWGILNLRNRTA